MSAVPLKANHADAEITTIHIPLLCCCATSFYSICFSIIKYCGYWNSQTLDRITDHANKFYKEKLNGNNHPLTINNFPRTLQIYDADINIAFNLEKQGILCCTSLGSKLSLQKLITDNTKDNTGFLMWISNYCFSCIFQNNNMKTKAKSVKYYIIRFSPDGTAFQSKIREGPYYICSVCNRIQYRKTVIQLKIQMYNTQQELFTELYTHDSLPSWNDLSPGDNLF